MKLSATHTFDAPRERVFRAITDPEVLQRCIDGCEKMVRTGEGAYDAHLKIGVAGLKGNYIGKVQLKDVVEPESYTLQVEGKGGPGFLKSTSTIRLSEVNGKTELQCEADAQVGGMIAMIGSRLIEATAKKMLREFLEKLGAQLQGKAEG